MREVDGAQVPKPKYSEVALEWERYAEYMEGLVTSMMTSTIPGLIADRDQLVEALRGLLVAEKLDDDDSRLTEARAKAADILAKVQK